MYFCQFYFVIFLFGGSHSFGDSVKGLSVCLSVGIDISLFNWKIIFSFFLRFIYNSFLFLIRVRAGVSPHGSFSFTAGL